MDTTGGRWPLRQVATLLALALLAAACGPVVSLELAPIDPDAPVREPPTPSTVLDADGNELATLGTEFREPITLDEVPDHVIAAVLTAEDRRFHEHRGVDARGVVRAALTNLATGEVGQGGSTITQQLVKLRYLPDAPRTMETKLAEARLARELEQRASKAEILEGYLDTIYLGSGAYGLGAAAWTYFRKDVTELSVAEAAMIAAIIPAPEAFSPTREPDLVRHRRDRVLRAMHEQGHLDADELAAAVTVPLRVEGRPPADETTEGHWVDLVVRTLLDDASFGGSLEERADRLYGGGLTIHTSLDPDIQSAARDTLTEYLPADDDPEAAIAVVEPQTGHVLAAVGNRAHAQLQFNLATQARRQPGSTFKAFVLAAAIEDGWHPDDLLDGTEGEIAPGWEVRNYDRRSIPRVTLAGATRTSVNTAFARLGLEVGLDRVAAMARASGVTSDLPRDDPQLTIGGGRTEVSALDLAAGFATLANLGVHAPTTVITAIEDAQGQTVWLPPSSTSAPITPAGAYVTLQVLQDAVERGTGLNARIDGWEVAGKTGTTSDHADAWFAGATVPLAAAVWIGHLEGRVPLENVRGVPRVTGGTLPAMIFSDVIGQVLAERPPIPFTLPSEHWRTVDIDPRSGLLAADHCPGERRQLPVILVPDEECPPPPPPRPAPEPPADDEDDADTVEPPDGEDAGDDAGDDDGEDPDDDAPESPDDDTGEDPDADEDDPEQ